MSWTPIYVLCFAVGTLWSVASLILGGMHLGHSAHTGSPHVHGVHAHSHAGMGRFAALVNPSSVAVFLGWFGGVGYLLTRHSGSALWINLAIALAFGVAGAWALAGFLRFLQARDQPLDPADYEMVGVLGRVSSTIRSDGVGEVIYVREGARRAFAARSQDGREIGRGEEVIVTRYENGIAHVRTWEAMTQ